MSDVDIQVFGHSGTWIKPARAAHVDITIRGGDGGAALSWEGVTRGDRGGTVTRSFAAGELPAEVHVEVGAGGRPGGRGGYALVVTHLSD